jgi:hypothetical protein
MKLTKQNEGIIQNCTTKIDIIAISSALVMARVNFIYENFVIETSSHLSLIKWQLEDYRNKQILHKRTINRCSH